MSFIHIPNVVIKGVFACVPKEEDNISSYHLFDENEAEKFSKNTGIVRRRISPQNVCTSDLCYHAAIGVITDLKWDIEDINCLIFVSQTPDFQLPATSSILQARLGLNEEVFTLDISSGCSGWIDGLQVIASLLSHGQIKKGLLLVGDTISKCCSTDDKSTFPLFGDAGTATALQFESESIGFKFNFGRDGSSNKTICIPDGAFRNQTNIKSFILEDIEPGIKRNKMHLILDGMSVFSFAISKVPESIIKLTKYFNVDLSSIDYFIFHQANYFINEKIRKKLNIEEDRVLYSLADFGNTSSASIPLTLCLEKGKINSLEKSKLLACGFGVGLAWGSVYFEIDKAYSGQLIEI